MSEEQAEATSTDDLLKKHRPVSPAPSDVSLRSEWSKGEPVNFKEPGSFEEERPVSPAPSDVSLRSDWSKGEPVSFNEPGSLEEERSVSPAPSDVSLRSDWSKGEPVNFKEPGPSQSQRSSSDSMKTNSTKEISEQQNQPISSLRERFRREILQHEDMNHPNQTQTEHIMREGKSSVTRVKTTSDIFKNSKRQTIRTVLTVGEAGIGKSFHVQKFIKEWAKNERSFMAWMTDSTKFDKYIIFPFTSSKLELIKDREVSLMGLLHHIFPETEQFVNSDFERFKVLFVLDGLDSYQLPLDFDNNDTLTDVREAASVDVLLTNLIRGKLLPSARLWITSRPPAANQLPEEYIDRKTEIQYKDVKHKLTANLKKRILIQHKEELRKHETDTELFEIKEVQNEKDKAQTFDGLFYLSKKKVRTVLMKGVPGVGKTFQTKTFMVDWAKGKSNKNFDFIVSFNFRELNLRKDENQSLNDLLHHSLSDNEHQITYNYDECKIAFVLDGLEKCKLPLDFAKNKDVTDMEESASMDVLLTNLIKGNFLPSAHLWIISQPSGVEKIPPEYIQKVTECRETSKRRKKLASSMKKRYCQEILQHEEINHPNQENKEHIMREEDKDGRPAPKSVIQVNTVSDIFKGTEGQTIRTVLTVGEAGIGKSFHVQKFIKEWAKNDKSPDKFRIWTWIKSKVGITEADEELIFLLTFSDLKKIEKKVSLMELLNIFFEATKQCVISNFEKFSVLFVLDGLEDYQPPPDCDNKDTLADVREPASVDVLLTNLIRGDLLPSARLWITSRPSAASLLPDTCVNRKTEIRYKPDFVSQQTVKSQLKEQFTRVSEGIDRQKTSAFLEQIFTDLYITEGERGDVNTQNEAQLVEDAKFKPETEETSIKYNNIFKPASTDEEIRTVLTKGIAGIGKSFATMKYMKDWAEGKTNEDIFFMFPLSFRELNLRKGTEQSLEELIHSFFPGMKTSEIEDYNKYKILFVLDGFDECRLDLDFSESNNWTDVRQQTSVKTVLTNLIQGNLLPNSQLWITSRPAASNSIPADKINRVTEVRGFNDDQKEEYFRRRFSDEDLAEKILSYVKKSRSLYIMCHIPVFCWITSKVLEDLVKRNEEGTMPKTQTDMYILFLLLECRQTNVKYDGDETGESSETDSCPNAKNKETIISLGKLAFEGLVKGDLVFTEENLKECGVDITESAVYSGLFTEIKREAVGVYPQTFFCFVHLSIQEFLAAFYVLHTFSDKGKNLLSTPASESTGLPPSVLYKAAVDKALESKNGDWDLFLRFLLGLSLETNQNLLQSFLKKTEDNKKTNKETAAYIKEKINDDNSDADKNLNLFYCLNELHDHSLMEEVKKCFDSGLSEDFTASQWSALTFVLLTSDEKLDVFDLKKYQKSEKVLLGMLPVVKVSQTALLSWCELTEESCRGLSKSVLSSPSSNVTELDLSHNDLTDLGVEALADGLKNPHCKLETLKLSGCQVTEKGCLLLASALKSNKKSSLTQLDLSYNHPGAAGVTELSAIAEDPNMKLTTVCFDHGGQHRLKPGLKKYGADLRLDESTASKRLVLSEGNRKVKTTRSVKEKVSRPENENRFQRTQVICEEGQKGLCYWEVDWKGKVGIAVTYRRVGRRWDSHGGLGCNEMSWSLLCSKTGYKALHGKKSEEIKVPPCQKIAVFLDWEGGTLSYYSVTSGNLSLIHTFKATFTEPLIPGFWFEKGCVTLCEIE